MTPTHLCLANGKRRISHRMRWLPVVGGQTLLRNLFRRRTMTYLLSFHVPPVRLLLQPVRHLLYLLDASTLRRRAESPNPEFTFPIRLMRLSLSHLLDGATLMSENYGERIFLAASSARPIRRIQTTLTCPVPDVSQRRGRLPVRWRYAMQRNLLSRLRITWANLLSLHYMSDHVGMITRLSIYMDYL